MRPFNPFNEREADASQWLAEAAAFAQGANQICCGFSNPDEMAALYQFQVARLFERAGWAVRMAAKLASNPAEHQKLAAEAGESLRLAAQWYRRAYAKSGAEPTESAAALMREMLQ